MKPPLFLQGGFLSLCVYPRGVDGSIRAQIAEYTFAILPRRRILQNRKIKSDNLTPLRSSSAPGAVEKMWKPNYGTFYVKTNTKSPLMLKKISVWESALHRHMRFLPDQHNTSLFLSLDLQWERQRRKEGTRLRWLMLRKETGASAHKAPSYNSLDTQSICPWHPVLRTGPTHRRRPFHMVPFCSAQVM